MNFGISDNSCMFVSVSRPRKLIQIISDGIFYAHLSAYFSKSIRLFKSRSGYLICLDSFLGRKKREANSLSYINQISSLMTKEMNLKPGDNSTLTSTQPSEKGKSQLQREKGKKFLGILKNILMFVPFNTTRTNKQAVRVIFIPVHFLSIYKTVGLSVALLQLCKSVLVVKNERLDSLSVFNNFKFIDK